jgi:hypothetical protein
LPGRGRRLRNARLFLLLGVCRWQIGGCARFSPLDLAKPLEERVGHGSTLELAVDVAGDVAPEESFRVGLGGALGVRRPRDVCVWRNRRQGFQAFIDTENSVRADDTGGCGRERPPRAVSHSDCRGMPARQSEGQRNHRFGTGAGVG